MARDLLEGGVVVFFGKVENPSRPAPNGDDKVGVIENMGENEDGSSVESLHLSAS